MASMLVPESIHVDDLQMLDVTVIIATVNRKVDLQKTLEDFRAGTTRPVEIRVIDASDNNETQLLCKQSWAPLMVTYMHSPFKSAAKQRNLGAIGCATDLILFCDDDVELPSDTLEKLVSVFQKDVRRRIGGVAGTIQGLRYHLPGRLLRLYYRILAGYDHKHYGGHFFGPAINLLPTDESDDPELYRSEWLNSGLTMYRTDLFAREGFPEFEGYSFQEDVNLSSRIGREHELYFHRGVRYIHKSSPGAHKANAHMLATMQVANRWRNAEELLGLTNSERWWKFMLSLTFDSLILLRGRSENWQQKLKGSWSAWWKVAVLKRKID
jgi:GT2 family glycosyltransferase